MGSRFQHSSTRRARHGGGTGQGFIIIAAHEGFTGLDARRHVVYRGQKSVTTRAAEQQAGRRRPGEVVKKLRSRLQLKQRGYGEPVTARTGKLHYRYRIDPAPVAEHQQGVHRAALKRAMQAIARLKGKCGRVVAMASAHPHPAFVAHHHGDRLIYNPNFDHGAFFAVDQSPSGIAESLGVGLDFAHHQTAQSCRATQDLLQLFLLVAQAFEFLLDPDRLQPGQLA